MLEDVNNSYKMEAQRAMKIECVKGVKGLQHGQYQVLCIHVVSHCRSPHTALDLHRSILPALTSSIQSWAKGQASSSQRLTRW